MNQITFQPVDVGPSLLVHTDAGEVWVFPFAIPVVAMDRASLQGRVPDHLHNLDEVCRLLHGLGGMADKVQGMYVHARLLSATLLANLASSKRTPTLAAMMVDDATRTSIGQESRLHEHIDFEPDTDDASHLRFALGCVYTFARSGRVPRLPSAEFWRSTLQSRVEASLALDWAGIRGGLVRCAVRPRVLAPAPLSRALMAGLLEVIRQGVDSIHSAIEPVIDFRDRHHVELRLIGDGPVLSFRLPSSELEDGSIEWLLDQIARLLSERDPSRKWAMSSARSH